MVQCVGKQRVQIGRIHKVQAGAVRHIVDADVVGFAQHALFGQHNIQNLAAGLGAGVILPGGGFGFVQALLQRGVGGHAAQISDLNFQLMAFAVDDLYVPLGHLILLALAFIQHVQRVHLFFHGRLFEQLSLQI